MEDASLGQREQPWTGGREGISGAETRTYAKLEAKARSGHDLEGGKLWWKGGRAEMRGKREETHQARCPSNGRGWLDALNRDGRRLRLRRRRRRLGHPTVQGKESLRNATGHCHTAPRIFPKNSFLFSPTARNSASAYPTWASGLTNKHKQKERPGRGCPSNIVQHPVRWNQ